MTQVLVLGGGPDKERDISIESARAVHQACTNAGYDAQLKIIDHPTLDEIKSWDAQVIFPVLHGRFGEGGYLQHMLEQAGHTYIGTRSKSSKLAMDKMGSKLLAANRGIPTPAACLLDPRDLKSDSTVISPLDLPLVIKPVSEGSSVGLYICKTQQDWDHAIDQVTNQDPEDRPVYMIERLMNGRELTVSVIADKGTELKALPIIEIVPAQGIYDYDAKYIRSDTKYIVNPDLPDEIQNQLKSQAIEYCYAIGVQDLARVDFMINEEFLWALLEVNTMPGFTQTSLMPKAAQAEGYSLDQLCDYLIKNAIKNA